MNILKVLFGNSEQSAEDEKREADDKKFDLMKYDGLKAMKIGRFDYAERCFVEALLVRDDLEVHEYLSRSMIAQSKYDEALGQLDTLIEAEPQNVALLLQAAHVAFLKEDYGLMERYATKATETDADNAAAYYLLARAAIGQSNLVNGIALLTKSIVLDDNYADARMLRSQTLLQMNDLQGADEDAQWLAEHVGEHEDVLLLCARVAKAKGESEQALSLYNKVTEVNPFQVDAYRERGQLRFELGDKDGAQADMQKVLELNPEEMADVSGDYSAEGIENKVRQAYSAVNPFGI